MYRVKSSFYKNVALLSIPIVLLVILVSAAGLLYANLYEKETLNWSTQAYGQDMIDLFVISPFLILSSWLVYQKKEVGVLLWSGIIFYLIYTFVIYAFGVHFNQLFIVYCLILGLAFYVFIYFLLTFSRHQVKAWFSNKIPRQVIGFYFIVLGALFYMLWLMEILPANISNTTPQIIIDTELLVNPIHALDLSVCLPGIIIVGILLLQKKDLGFLLAPTILVFFILMDLTIGVLTFVMNIRGLTSNMNLILIMTILAIFSAVLLLLYLGGIKRNNQEHIMNRNE